MSITVEISINGDLIEVAEHIEKTFGLNAVELVNYASNAPHVHSVADSIWPIGSIFPNEYRLLYGLVRTIKPKLAIEAGTYWGCSATAILSAMAKNEMGKLVSLDTMQGMGGRIPNEYRHNWEAIQGDAGEIFRNRQFAIPCNFFFEDTQHTKESTIAIVGAAIPHMAKGAFMACHDPVSRPAVLDGLAELGIKPEVYLLEGSNCGVALWRNL